MLTIDWARAKQVENKSSSLNKSLAKYWNAAVQLVMKSVNKMNSKLLLDEEVDAGGGDGDGEEEEEEDDVMDWYVD